MATTVSRGDERHASSQRVTRQSGNRARASACFPAARNREPATATQVFPYCDGKLRWHVHNQRRPCTRRNRLGCIHTRSLNPSPNFTVKKLATYWRCDSELIHRRIRHGYIRAFKIGGGWGISAAVVARIEATGPIVDARLLLLRMQVTGDDEDRPSGQRRALRGVYQLGGRDESYAAASRQRGVLLPFQERRAGRSMAYVPRRDHCNPNSPHRSMVIC